jgi:hypothetical protein
MIESITVIPLLLSALNRADLQAIFDRDPYESRRSALPGARLIEVLVVYPMIGTEKLRELIRTLTEHAGLPAALGGTVALNTLSNGIAQRNVGPRVEAWGLILQTYGPSLERRGRKFARIAVVDASLIKRHRSVANFMVNLMAGLIAYTHQPLNPPSTLPKTSLSS